MLKPVVADQLSNPSNSHGEVGGWMHAAGFSNVRQDHEKARLESLPNQAAGLDVPAVILEIFREDAIFWACARS